MNGPLRRLAGVALAPVLVVQGRRVRRTTPRLPEADGAREGERGDGSPLSVLFVGDSSVAGVGVASQDEALLGRTLARLVPVHRVRFRLVARTGWTTADALEHLDALADTAGPAARFDVAVTALGVNDLTARVPVALWLERQRTLRERLRTRFGVGRVVVSGLPPVSRFPALPQPLRAWLGGVAATRDLALERDVARDPGATYVPLRSFSEQARMSEDGFHPGPLVYDEWAARVAAAVLDAPGTGPGVRPGARATS